VALVFKYGVSNQEGILCSQHFAEAVISFQQEMSHRFLRSQKVKGQVYNLQFLPNKSGIWKKDSTSFRGANRDAMT
jgi:hypothetical protein